MFYTALLWVAIFIAFAFALVGAMGLPSLLLLDSAHWAIRLGVWLASLAAVAGLSCAAISLGILNGNGCTRKHPCYGPVQQAQPTTIRVQLDLPGTPTPEDCSKAVAERQRTGELPSNVAIEVACH